MARKYIVVDDLTDQEMSPDAAVRVTLEFTSVPAPETGTDTEVIEAQTSEWEVTEFTAIALREFIKTGDLAGFIVDMRPYVKLAGTGGDSDVVRKWVREAHPEITVGEKGRIPAEVMALYRREVSAKSAAPDAK